MLDASPSVRSEVLVLLRGLPKEDVEEHIEQLQLFIRAGITHIAVGIRSSSLDMLNWACLFCSDALVSCPGGWFKVLTSLMAMQGWTLEDSSLGWSSSKTSFAKSDSDGKAMVKGLNVLAVFLRVGFQEPSEQSDPGTYGGTYGWPLTDTAAHMISKRSNAFGHLNLFGPPRDEESQEYPDEDERQDIFQQKFRKPLERALTAAKKEAGEYGRAAATVLETISESMKTFDEGERNVGYRTSAHARIPRANR